MTKNFADLIEEDKEFLKIQDDSIGSVTATIGKDSYTLESPKKGEVKVATVPEGKKPKPFVPDQLFVILPSAVLYQLLSVRAQAVRASCSWRRRLNSRMASGRSLRLASLRCCSSSMHRPM